MSFSQPRWVVASDRDLPFNPQPKWPSGKTLQEERKETRADRKKYEAEVKAAVQRRDRYRCRVPKCREKGEWAHLNHRGMGGNPDGSRSETATTLLLCHSHHQGPESLDQGWLEVIPLTKDGCDGPVAFHWLKTGVTVKESSSS